MKRNAPAILTSIGVAGFAATTVLVGKAVLRSQSVIGDMKDDVDRIGVKPVDDDYTAKDQAKEVAQVYVRRSVELLKIYSPAIMVGSASVLCILTSNGIMRKQRAGLIAAYTALDSGFRAYRTRVEEEVGPERELDIYRGVRRAYVEGENPDEVQACLIERYDDVIPSVYGRFFDESSPSWSKTPEYNLTFLKAQERFANDRLRTHGFVFLNEIYEALGLKRSQAGQIVGWKLGSGGDDYIDFGIYDITDECNRAFVNGIERTVFLDFNVDGIITID
jgi:hypothetical protein